MSGGRAPSAGVHAGSRWSWRRDAARAHWTFRWAVGATMTTGAGRFASTVRSAVSANVVLPAPGVATARKSGCAEAAKRARAACCQGRRVTLRDTGEPVSHGPDEVGYGPRVDPSLIARAVEILRAGGLVAFPTETVYGLGADASNPAAVARIFVAKGRPADHPLIVHIASAGALPSWAADVPPLAAVLAEALWPGPLTIVLRRGTRVPDGVTGGLPTVGLR